MSSAAMAVALHPHIALQDPLAYLPGSKSVRYKRGQLIYSPELPSDSIYFIIAGRTKVCLPGSGGNQSIVDFFQADDLFGESTLSERMHHNENAAALETTDLMSWSRTDVEAIATSQPKFAIAMIQMSVRRSSQLMRRITSCSLDNVIVRLARALLQISERASLQQVGDWTNLKPVSQKLLSEYIGTSRECLTKSMVRLRALQQVQSSRRGISVNRKGLEAWLQDVAGRSRYTTHSEPRL